MKYNAFMLLGSNPYPDRICKKINNNSYRQYFYLKKKSISHVFVKYLRLQTLRLIVVL